MAILRRYPSLEQGSGQHIGLFSASLQTIWSAHALSETKPGQLPLVLITEEFRQTLDFLFHLFPYSKHPHYPSGLSSKKLDKSQLDTAITTTHFTAELQGNVGCGPN